MNNKIKLLEEFVRSSCKIYKNNSWEIRKKNFLMKLMEDFEIPDFQKNNLEDLQGELLGDPQND